jgi:hypothetical protein
MDFFRTKLCPSRCYLTFFHIPERSGTSKTTGWFTKTEMINLPHMLKCYSKHTFLYTLMDFFESQMCQSRCYLTFFHFPERSIASEKRLAGSPKG